MAVLQSSRAETDRHACHAVKFGARIDNCCCLYTYDKHAGQSKQRQLKKDMCTCAAVQINLPTSHFKWLMQSIIRR